MGRSAASIQAAIDIIEAHLASADSLVASSGSNVTNISFAKRSELVAELNQLYMQLDRATGASPVFTRGHVDGLR